MLLSAICKMSANSGNRKRCGVSVDLQNASQLAQPKKIWGIDRFSKCQTTTFLFFI